MATLELTDAQVFALLEQLPKEQKKRLATRLIQNAEEPPQPVFGSAKNDILYMADDFDAPLEEFEEYM